MPAWVTRTGVLTYRRADGTLVRELRHPDQVFASDSLATLRDASVTIGHPGNGQTWVSPENASELEVGVVHDAAPEGEFVRSRLSVRRADAIKRIDSKELVEVSCGYDCAIDPTPGVYEGQPYDQQQTAIRYNHLALLAAGKGRCGRDVRLRVDSGDAIIEEAIAAPVSTANVLNAHETTATVSAAVPTGTSSAISFTTTAQPIAPQTTRELEARADSQGEMMTLRKVRVDGVEYEVPETAASMLDKLIGERDGHKKRADAAEGERDVMREQLAQAQNPTNVQQLVRARVELERSAGSVLGAETRVDSLTDRQVREKVLSVVSPSFKVEGRSDDAITAAFDYALSTQGKVNRGLQLVGEALGTSAAQQSPEQSRADASDVWAQFDELEEKRRNAWRGKAS